MNKIKNYTKGLVVLLTTFVVLLFFKNNTYAQNAISLSITPPLFEVLIKPGKEVKQIYTISNNGGDTLVTPRIVYFEPEGQAGDVKLTENEAPNWVRYNKEPFVLKFQEDKQFNVIISPPEGEAEIDHFLTLIFETSTPTDLLSNNSTFYKSEIGTNILITVSVDGNPKKSAEILNFTAPKIIDSTYPIKYLLTLSNNGSSFWKPNGKIIVNSEAESHDQKTLKLASLNILSGGKRDISCVDNETLIDCVFDEKFSIGKQTAILEFTIDDEEKIYKKEVTTFAFPFIYTGIGLILLTLLRIKGIFKTWQKRK